MACNDFPLTREEYEPPEGDRNESENRMTLEDMLVLRIELDPNAPDMIVIPDALNRIADKVLAYRPKAKRKKARKRKRPKKAKKNG